MASATAEQTYFPISELSAYQNKWTIKAKVTGRSQVRTFSRGAGEGKVFSAELLDGAGGEIRASFFNDAAGNFDDVLKVGKVYTFSKGTVKVANRQYNNTNSKYELTFDRDAQIVEVASGEAEVFKVLFTFTDFTALQSRQVPCRVDLCGVVTQCRQQSTITTKDGRELIKRDITLVDDTAKSIDVTLWGENAKRADADFEGNPVLALKSILVKDFNGTRTGGTVEGSSIQINPELPEVKRVQQWWENGGSNQSFGNFIDIQTVQSKPLPCRADLCGVVTQVQPVATVRAKDGRELTKRDITIADNSAMSMDVTLWGTNVQKDSDLEGNPVIALTSILVKEWNGGRSGSTLDVSRIALNPDAPAAVAARKWWSQDGGSAQNITALSVRGGGGGAARAAEHCTISEMRQRAETLASDVPMLMKVSSRLSVVQMRKQGEQTPLHYRACAEIREGQYGGLTCNKRVDESGFCVSCNKSGKTATRLNVRCKFSDCGDSAWLTTFHEAAEQVLGMPADKLAEIDNGAEGRDRLEALLKKSYFAEPVELLVRAKLDSYNGEPRPNVTCISAAPVNRRERGRKLLAEIHQMLSVGPAGGA